MEWQSTSLTSSERGIRERINVIEGYWEDFDKAWKLKSEIKAHLGQLQHFEDTDRDFTALGQRAASVDLPPKEGVFEAVKSARKTLGSVANLKPQAEGVRMEADNLSNAAKELIDKMTRYNGQVKSAIEGFTQANQQAQNCASYQLGANETPPEKDTDGNGEKEQAEVRGFISLGDETQPGIQRTGTGDEAEGGGFEIVSEETIPPLGQHTELSVVEEEDKGEFESLGAETRPGTDERQAFDKAEDQDQGGFRSEGEGETRRREDHRSLARPFSISGNGPSAFHIFATGSRMGWAGGLARYSVGPSDQSIIDHLTAAGEHTKAAYDTSLEPTRAWPNWQSIQGNFRSWGQQLARSPEMDYRRQLASTLEGSYGPMAEQLGFQTVGETQRAANCDAGYCRLGYLMAYGQQALQIAEGAASVGDTSLREKSQQDGIAHLGQAINVLNNMEKVVLASGYCVDLRDVKQQLVSILNGGSLSGRVRKITAAWQTALERIRNQQSPPERVAETQIPPPGLKPTPPALSQPGQEEDPGELSGEWSEASFLSYDSWNTCGCNIGFDRPAQYRFRKNGSIYVGEKVSAGHSLKNESCHYTIVNNSWGMDWTWKIEPATVVYKLNRTGPNTYEGESMVVSHNRGLEWRKTVITVERDSAKEAYTAHPNWPIYNDRRDCHIILKRFRAKSNGSDTGPERANPPGKPAKKGQIKLLGD